MAYEHTAHTMWDGTNGKWMQQPPRTKTGITAPFKKTGADGLEDP